MKPCLFAIAALWAGMAALSAETVGKLQVAALHPLLADLARHVGGDPVEVHDLVGEGSNPHRFEPRPEDMERMRASALILAAGMGLESYLGRLRDTLGDDKVLEVGATLPSLELCGDAHCTDHSHDKGGADPHWWHSIDHMSRATRILATAFGKLDPEHAAVYQQNAATTRSQLADLKRWAKLELAKVPATQRKLVTAHHAFGYFADEFGFEMIAIAGLNAEQETSPQDLAETINHVREASVGVVFPELFSSNRTLEAVSKATGARIGTALIADGNGKGDATGFEGMIRHNVNAIVTAIGAAASGRDERPARPTIHKTEDSRPERQK